MTTMMIERFAAYGVPQDAGEAEPLETTLTLYDVDELKSLVDLGFDTARREAHANALFGSAAAAATADEDESLLRRVEQYVFGNAALSEEDRAEVEQMFPLAVVASVASGPLTVNSMVDLSTPDGSLRIVSYTDVTMLQGGYFVCAATPLIFTCETLTRTGDSGTGAADFNILGRIGAPQKTPDTPGAATQAAGGSPGTCSSAGVSDKSGGPGNSGKPGTAGTEGFRGNPGTPSQIAAITISRTLNGQLTIHTQSGQGGQGGNGGAGGNGQQGGDGGKGATCGCTGSAGGPGGDGGQGGQGGRAGDGGNGVDAAGNVTVFVPSEADVAKIVKIPTPAPPGEPGTPGPGGGGGGGGRGGAGGKDNRGGSDGGAGGPGATGMRGNPGTVHGAPAQINVQPL